MTSPPFRINRLLDEKPVGKQVEVNGWIRTRRDAKGMSFVELNDGSCRRNLQIVAEKSLPNYEDEIIRLSTGCCIRARGELVDSPAAGQEVELQAAEIMVYGWADPETYPLQKKRHSLEFLRTVAHLRPRTNSLAAVARIRSALSAEIHHFFKERGFCQIHTPIITASDCEGAGELFTVTTLEPDRALRQNGSADYGADFFGCRTGLTVSGQLEAEIYALALGNVYTFGPAFRAEKSNTSRHLAEFWMVEPEMAFCDLAGDVAMAEEFVRHLIGFALTECREDLELFYRFVDKDLQGRLEAVLGREFSRITYTEAVDRLAACGQVFEYPVTWGADLQAEHERFLTEEIFGSPVIVTDYPQGIKPFYMRVNDDGRTVAAMDLLFPGIGEIIGGSQREERFDVLAGRMREQGIDPDNYGWYLDLRRYGSAPHAGFGLGFERLVQFITGLGNIRDVIPFPRTPGNAAF